MKKKLPKTFCPLPWVNLSTDVNGSLRPCCKFKQPKPSNEYQLPNMKEGPLDVLWNDERYQNLRQAFLKGKKPKECQTCWDEEDAGILSFRLDFCENKKISIDDLDFKPIAKKGPKSIDFKLNNVCNLKCRICGPQASSTFLKEHQERFNIKIEESGYWLSNKILGTANESVIKKWADDLIHLEMTGGEPMASPENIKIMELLIEQDKSQNISVMVNTNGTLYNKRFLELLLKFKEVKLCISIDDLGSRLEYQRHPTEWTDVINNLIQFLNLQSKNKNLFILLCPTVSIFNIYHLPLYHQWASSLNIETFYNILHYPPNQSIKNLPDKLKKIVSDRLTEPEFEPVKNFLHLPQEGKNLIREFIIKNNLHDKFRNQNFREVFEEWGNLVMDYKDE